MIWGFLFEEDGRRRVHIMHTMRDLFEGKERKDVCMKGE